MDEQEKVSNNSIQRKLAIATFTCIYTEIYKM